MSPGYKGQKGQWRRNPHLFAPTHPAPTQLKGFPPPGFFWFFAFSDLSTDCGNLKKIAKILFDFSPVFGDFSIIFPRFFAILGIVGIF